MNIKRSSSPLIKPVEKIPAVYKDKKDKTLNQRQLEAKATEKGKHIDIKI